MTYFGLNSEYVDAKGIERLCSSYQEENIKASADLAVVSATTDLKQMPAIGVSVVSADLDLTLKEVLRNTHWNVDHPVRKALWKFLFKRVSTDDDDIDLYHEMVKDLFGESYHPSSLPSFVDPAYCIRYHLNAEGRKNVEKILHVIRHIKPDITYCPVLYPLTSLLLHYMSDGMAFACIMKLLNDKQNYMSQTKADHTASAYLVMKLTKKYARNAYSQLEKELKEHEDLESMFQNWLSWIFKGLPFPYVVRVMDCFLVEKKKCLYRIVLALLILYSKNSDADHSFGQSGKCDKSANEDLGMMQKLLDYFQNITVPIDKIFKIAYGIRGFSERVVNQQLVKVQMTLKSHTNLSERSMSADRLSPTNPVYHVDMDSASQLVVRELKMDASSRARSVGVVALGNFKSGIISAEQMSLIWSWLPIRISMYQPEVIYSSNEHGVCLTAFYMAAGKWEPTVLVIKSMNDEVFGAYCSSSWNSRNSTDVNNKKYTYFGTGECFLFTLVPEAKRYPWVGCSSDNVPHSAKLFMAADSNMINVGAGNGQGLVLFDNLYHGRTEHCDTFDNEPLCNVKDFQCKVVEVICFK